MKEKIKELFKFHPCLFVFVPHIVLTSISYFCFGNREFYDYFYNWLFLFGCGYLFFIDRTLFSQFREPGFYEVLFIFYVPFIITSAASDVCFVSEGVEFYMPWLMILFFYIGKFCAFNFDLKDR